MALHITTSDGKRKRDDNFSGLWKAFKANHPQRLKAMDIRGSAANLITGDNRLSLQVKFLSDVPSGVILKHYLEPTQPEFNQAVDGLRKVLHQPSKRKAKAG